jgi:hypothetical protein
MEKRTFFVVGVAAGTIATLHGLHSTVECRSGGWCEPPAVDLPHGSHPEPVPFDPGQVTTVVVQASTTAATSWVPDNGFTYLPRPNRPNFPNDNRSNNPGWL